MVAGKRTYRMTARAEQVYGVRQRILTAARARFGTLPYEEVRLSDVAADAGVSPQTLHNHFSSKDGLLADTLQSFADAFAEDIWTLRGKSEPGDVAGAVRGLVRQYERLGDSNVRLLLLEQRSPAAAELLAAGRKAHQAWLGAMFGGRLPDDRVARGRALAALYAATDVGTWKLLRRDRGLSRPATVAAMELLVEGVLAAGSARSEER